MQRLSLKRNRKINYFFHVISKLVILYCQIWEIDTIVIGRSKHWKQDVDLGAVNNQNFVFIPFYKLVNMIRYKAEELGIRVIESDEAYTSLCSFLDWETIEKHETYLGKRIKRGLFRSAKGVLINSDLNGAYNHMRNAIPESMDELRKLVMEDGIEAVRIHPVRAALC
jgi:putative transposase